MPRCKHKMYCVCFSKVGGSPWIVNQTMVGLLFKCSVIVRKRAHTIVTAGKRLLFLLTLQ